MRSWRTFSELTFQVAKRVTSAPRSATAFLARLRFAGAAAGAAALLGRRLLAGAAAFLTGAAAFFGRRLLHRRGAAAGPRASSRSAAFLAAALLVVGRFLAGGGGGSTTASSTTGSRRHGLPRRPACAPGAGTAGASAGGAGAGSAARLLAPAPGRRRHRLGQLLELRRRHDVGARRHRRHGEVDAAPAGAKLVDDERDRVADLHHLAGAARRRVAHQPQRHVAAHVADRTRRRRATSTTRPRR